VTAEFNRNVLRRINRDLRGEFRPERFRHRAVYRQREGRVEMGLVSVEAQIVPIIDLGVAVSFERGEAIYTENSYKYSLFEIRALASAAGFRLERQWLEGGYSLNLFAPQSRSSCR
jgi:L-histidine Nalpha-methyltransferase